MKKSAPFALVVVLAFAALASAETPQTSTPAAVPVQWNLTASMRNHLSLKKGAAVTAKIHAVLQPGWHVYAMDQKPGGPIAARIVVPLDQAFILDGDIDESQPTSLHDTTFNMESRFFKDEANFSIPLSVAKAGSPKLSIDVRYQACNDRICLSPTTAHLSTTVSN